MILSPEEWGGETIVVPVSAHTKQGIDQLLDLMALASRGHGAEGEPEGHGPGRGD